MIVELQAIMNRKHQRVAVAAAHENISIELISELKQRQLSGFKEMTSILSMSLTLCLCNMQWIGSRIQNGSRITTSM
jgi:hypothetical protein